MGTLLEFLIVNTGFLCHQILLDEQGFSSSSFSLNQCENFMYSFNYIYNCIIPFEFLPWEIQAAFPRESQLRQSCYLTYGAWWVFQCFYNPPNSDMDYIIFNVNACDCTWGWMDICERVCTGSWLFEKNLNLRQWHASPVFYRLSYTPIPHGAALTSEMAMRLMAHSNP